MFLKFFSDQKKYHPFKKNCFERVRPRSKITLNGPFKHLPTSGPYYWVIDARVGWVLAADWSPTWRARSTVDHLLEDDVTRRHTVRAVLTINAPKRASPREFYKKWKKSKTNLQKYLWALHRQKHRLHTFHFDYVFLFERILKKLRNRNL